MPEPAPLYYIKNWWKFQHYNDRRPPWIKLHRSIETDPAFQSLSEINQYRLIKLWLLASDMDGTWSGLNSYLTRTWGLHKHSNTVQVLAEFESKGLISKKDIRGLKRGNASPSQRERQRQSREESTNTSPQAAPPSKKFIPPNHEELAAYMSDQGFTEPVNKAQDFISYYETRGWIPGGQRTQMKSWKAAVRTWKSKEAGNGNGHSKTRFQNWDEQTSLKHLEEAARQIEEEKRKNDAIRISSGVQ